jgi:hypothetical protein
MIEPLYYGTLLFEATWCYMFGPIIRLIKNEKDVLHPLLAYPLEKGTDLFHQTINQTYFPFLLYLIVVYVNRHSFSIFAETLELTFLSYIYAKIITQSVKLYLFLGDLNLYINT